MRQMDGEEMEETVWSTPGPNQNVWYRAEYEMVDSNIGMRTSFHTNQGLSYRWRSLSALGSVYQFVFEAQLQLDLYNQAVEGDLAIDDVVLHPGCV